jgi:hypothetical protein
VALPDLCCIRRGGPLSFASATNIQPLPGSPTTVAPRPLTSSGLRLLVLKTSTLSDGKVRKLATCALCTSHRHRWTVSGRRGVVPLAFGRPSRISHSFKAASEIVEQNRLSCCGSSFNNISYKQHDYQKRILSVIDASSSMYVNVDSKFNALHLIGLTVSFNMRVIEYCPGTPHR